MLKTFGYFREHELYILNLIFIIILLINIFCFVPNNESWSNISLFYLREI
jgi:hypothetical protein